MNDPANTPAAAARLSQPTPATPEAKARRDRAGNTLRFQTGRGTWAPINVGADGRRFQRQQLTTKLAPAARERLEQLAKDAGLRICEVIEALVLAPGAAKAVAAAGTLGVRPDGQPAGAPPAAGRDRTGERRIRLTKTQAERVDAALLELVARDPSGRAGRAELERAAAALAADGLPLQGLNTLRTRLRRLALRQGG